MTEEKGRWGGSRPGAGNPGFKPKWKSGKTTVIRVPEAIADEVLSVARQIDEDKPLDSVTARKQVANEGLYQKVGELEIALFKANHELQRVTKERDEYFEELGCIQLELENLKDKTVTQSSEVNLPSAGKLLNALRAKFKNSKVGIKDVELILELIESGL